MAVDLEGRWQAGIGDPTVVGWITVAVYGITALLALRCARRSGDPLEFRFWSVLTIALLMLGVNKQLDLQSLVTQIGRDLAFAHGWYHDRRVVQFAFIGLLLALGVSVGAVLLWTARRLPPSTQIATLGIVLLVVFVVIRGASFHHVDELLGSKVQGVRYNWLLELTPLAVIAVSALRRRAVAKPGAGRRKRRRRRTAASGS
jgi:hypothetical protein